ncbi:MAG: FtsX-like permease family protein [Clostridiales bacterium]|nr:FtsX-like permease family protein [Clostridiales bacterium]
MLLKKLFRTAWRYKAQFISMIIMVAIGIGVFVGFNMEWYSLYKDTGDFFEQTAYADFRIMNEQGFTMSDIEAIKNIDGVDEATRVLNVNVDVKDEGKSLALFVSEDYNVSTMLVTSGEKYDKGSDGFWLSDKYAAANGIKTGDTLTVTYRSNEISGEVVGLVKSGEFMICTSGSNQLMPDYTAFGFVYASPEKIETALGGDGFYPQINVLSGMSKAQMERAVSQALGKTTLVLGKDEHTAYAGAQSEMEEGKTMVSVLPMLFLLIGILTMITTMHRITANEKTQIGTLKALGFKNKKILAHYTSYGLFIGIVGAVLGIALGFGICALIINPAGMMSTYMDLPKWGLHAPWWTWLILVGVVAFLTLISFLSVKKMLKGTAADALRPYAPKKVKPLAIEGTKVWGKMGFATKWNLRDVFRHKTRTLMTLVGILGCMVLLVGGLGMKDTMTGFLNTLDKQILNYGTRVNFTETVTNGQAIEFAERYGGDYVAATSVQVKGEPIALEVYNVTHGCVRFIDRNNRRVTLKDEGAYISLRVAERGYKVGDTLAFSPYGSEETYEVKVAGILRSLLTESITVTSEYADAIGLPYTVSAAFLNVGAGDIESAEFVAGTQSKAAIMDSYNSFMEVMDTMVWVLVLAAVVLGVVVLYNLGVMSYTERSRELATLKVVGFKNKHIGRILIGQNIWLTVVGIIIGLPAGVGVLYLLITLLASEYELKLTLGALTYCVSILLTFGVSMLVSLIVARKNRRINMVEALKGAE